MPVWLVPFCLPPFGLSYCNNELGAHGSRGLPSLEVERAIGLSGGLSVRAGGS